MEEKSKQKKLPEERYDKKLFKQAVKAAKEAKEIELKQRRRKRLRKDIIIFLSAITFSFVIYLILPLLQPKAEYTIAIKYPVDLGYKEITGEILNGYTDSNLEISNLKSQSILVFNPLNGDILFEKDSLEKKSIASLTKLMSAIIILENFKLDDIVTVSLENIPKDVYLQLGVKEGDKITVENILKAMLISSYNDSAYVIANAYPYGGYDGFIKAMNRKAEALNMKGSHFVNPAGLDQEGNYSTAFDIGILASVARKYPDIMNTVKKEKDTVTWSTQGGLLSTEVVSTNKLIQKSRYIGGLKTGNTDLAGECFVGYFVYPSGNELITVVLNSQDRFGDTESIEGYVRKVLK